MNELIKTLRDLSHKDVRDFGGKAAHLGELITLGVPVPDGFCISHQTIATLMSKITVRASVNDAELRVKLEEIIRPFLERLAADTGNGELLAVRSSASGEDSAGASFAGQFDSILGVRTLDEVCDAIILCWKSNSSGRAISYTRKRKLLTASMSVIVQQLIVPETAGVCFTCHPVTFDKDVVVVEANWGFGDTVVSGMVTPDHFEVSAETRKVKTRLVARKRRMSTLLEGKIKQVPIREDQQRRVCLNDEDLLKIVETALNIQAHFKHPQDIE
jgi:phosphoenolpyruvate synthase/pyruvate phosphate dikinase